MTTTAPPEYMIHTLRDDSAPSSDVPAGTLEQALVRAAAQRATIEANRQSGCVVITRGSRILQAWIRLYREKKPV